MPQQMSALGDSPVPKTLVLAVPKAGKTTTLAITATAAFGGTGYIACCSSREHLRGAKDGCARRQLPPPEFDMIKSIEDMEGSLKAGRAGAKESKYAWVMVDDFGLFATTALNEFATQHRGDGRKYWDAYTRHVQNVILRWMDLKVPLFVTMHFVEAGAEMDGQVAKSGPGIVPAIQGAVLRQWLAGAFPQVIWMEKRGAERIFRLSVEGVTGPGCNNLPDDVREIPADVGILVKALAGEVVGDSVKGKKPSRG